jgi:hypothetical protein
LHLKPFVLRSALQTLVNWKQVYLEQDSRVAHRKQSNDVVSQFECQIVLGRVVLAVSNSIKIWILSGAIHDQLKYKAPQEKPKSNDKDYRDNCHFLQFLGVK